MCDSNVPPLKPLTIYQMSKVQNKINWFLKLNLNHPNTGELQHQIPPQVVFTDVYLDGILYQQTLICLLSPPGKTPTPRNHCSHEPQAELLCLCSGFFSFFLPPGSSVFLVERSEQGEEKMEEVQSFL